MLAPAHPRRRAAQLLLALASLTAPLAGCSADAPPQDALEEPMFRDDGAADGAGSTSPALLAFRVDFGSPAPTRALVAGETVRIAFDPKRFEQVAAWSDGTGQYYGSLGCGAGTCCDSVFDHVTVNYRFSRTGAFQTAALGATGSVDVTLPTDAAQLEVYFAAADFSLKKYDCNCDQACAQRNEAAATPRRIERPLWDSHFGHNYTFPVAPPPPPRGATISFGNVWDAPSVSAALRAGQTVHVQFDKNRFTQIINGASSVGYFASSFHCYGYGCCEVGYPTVGVHYRFAGSGEFAHRELDATSGFDIAIPRGTTRLELYFDVQAFDLKTWYCGCSGECLEQSKARASNRSVPYRAWDSRYGNNYVFDVRR